LLLSDLIYFVFFIPCLCFVLCTKFKEKKKSLKKIKNKKERCHKKNKRKRKKKVFSSVLFLFDIGDDSMTNPFEERGNDENQQASLKDPLLAD
jgi:hypothetical protein